MKLNIVSLSLKRTVEYSVIIAGSLPVNINDGTTSTTCKLFSEFVKK